MGWSSANEIFNPVAATLQKAQVDDDTKRSVLHDLIYGLQEGDWDTEDESLELFLDDPAIVAAFHARKVHTHDRRCCQRTRLAEAQDRITEALTSSFGLNGPEGVMAAVSPQTAAQVVIDAIRDLIGGEQS
ncbi:hypothetical protein KBY55_09435 [Streptomyces sp. b94]|uniref:hypothetical protein n=1 Tax=Streptomyces sp. b94 TaxID=1827634 RepID=UPI001B36271D|nr:hypothetical protein [Streptomyces sp. b94]MBQ1096305.1 hypothetical protein [Streptomyces sp. b94]